MKLDHSLKKCREMQEMLAQKFERKIFRKIFDKSRSICALFKNPL